jgi:hypothetical protein
VGRTQPVLAAAGLLVAGGVDAVVLAAAGVEVVLGGAVVGEGACVGELDAEPGEAVTVFVMVVVVDPLGGRVVVHRTPDENVTLPPAPVVIAGEGLVTTHDVGAVALVVAA